MAGAGDEWCARLKDVSQRYGKAVALEGVTLDIPANRMIGMIGPDGVGKSTLLAIVAGVRVIQTGSVEVLGGDIADARFRNAVAARIAYLPQGLGKNLYPTLSVVENIDFFGRLFGQIGRGARDADRRTAEKHRTSRHSAIVPPASSPAA